MATNNITKAVVKALADHIKQNCPSFTEIYEGFPNPNQSLKYPCGSIFIGEPKLNPLGDQYKIGHEKNEDGTPKFNPDGSLKVSRVVGDYEFRFQLDLWCESKPQRHSIYTEFFNGFNNDTGVMGKSLKLADYFNLWAHYTIDDFSFPDTEEQAQRNEWRVKIDLIVDCKAVMQRNEFLIQNIENNFEMPEVIAPQAEDPEGVSIE